MWNQEKEEEEEEMTPFGRHPGLEYEITPDNSFCDEQEVHHESRSKNLATDTKLLLVFLITVLSGTANTVFAKLQAVPMYNYPNFLTLYGNFMFIPAMFAYIIPVAKFGWFNNAISTQQLQMSKRPFAVMGCLDCLAGMMQIFASVYLPGPLLVLLPQAAIPISMLLSRQILNKRYAVFQCVGALVVITGIMVVLEPVISRRHSPDMVCQALDIEEFCTMCQVETSMENCLSHRSESPPVVNFTSYLASLGGGDNKNSTDGGDALCEWVETVSASAREEELVLIWSLVMIVSCIPMALSSIYKEVALGDDGQEQVDPIYLNGWVAVFQLLFSLILTVPAGMAASPPVEPSSIPSSLYNGLKCYFGHGSVDTGCHPDSMCSSHAFLLVNLFLVATTVYAIAYTLLIKYGSANLLFLASTAIIPLGNLAFSLPFMPQVSTIHLADLLGLGVIITGLFLYRFGDSATDKPDQEQQQQEQQQQQPQILPLDDLRDPLLTEES